jgi:hypothetical protein
MQYVKCLISLNNDPLNQLYKEDVSVAELELLRRIHGEMAVSEIRVTHKARVAHGDELDRLKQEYPYQEERIIGLSRDFGGKLPADVRDLRIENQLYSRDPIAAHDQAETIAKLAEADAEEEN